MVWEANWKNILRPPRSVEKHASECPKYYQSLLKASQLIFSTTSGHDVLLYAA